jgi:FKBP-type peptidyl-prolyl cis-trans isomerase
MSRSLTFLVLGALVVLYPEFADAEKRKKNRSEEIPESQMKAIRKLRKMGARWIERKLAEDGVTKNLLGLVYRVVEEGDGLSPGRGVEANVTYMARTENGDAPFDSGSILFTAEKNGPWSEAIPMMCEGDVWQLFIPHAGVGRYGTNFGIGPENPVIFTLKINHLTEPGQGRPCEEARREQQAKLSSYWSFWWWWLTSTQEGQAAAFVGFLGLALPGIGLRWFAKRSARILDEAAAKAWAAKAEQDAAEKAAGKKDSKKGK